MQTENRFLDGMARFLTDAAGAAQAFRSEMESVIKVRFERLISDLDLPATFQQNRERGVKFTLPAGPNQVVTRP